MANLVRRIVLAQASSLRGLATDLITKLPSILFAWYLIAILDYVDDICRGAQLCAPTRCVLHPIENYA
ncbi:hypothetical protein Chro_1526 [Chroococcidiopsis thermalis PCC 7203]|uniref:Uncharacterized protein n=1 Tax=Chroococcidiopsis thermalis (strain PCC 7203) TaxID=251229 RepID=K9TWU6_CHRTP|nr:hypothetical protein Chro_1526 [Chroococcidiopsis thermalis PCC 7203]